MHCALDARRFGVQPQRMPQQHRRAADRRVWIGDAPAGDVGAEPWIGSYRPMLPSPNDADGSSPSEPASIEASSVRMSPNMFSVTITSYSRGLAIRCIAIE